MGPPRSAILGRVAANPASCRVTHCATPALGQRGLTGPLRSKARSRSKDREASSLLQSLRQREPLAALFMLKQPLLSRQSAAKTGQGAVAADHPMARDDDRNRVTPIGSTHRP